MNLAEELPVKPADAESSPEPYSPSDIARLMVNSFRFSRGNAGTQHDILRFLVDQYRPRFSQEAVEASREIATAAAFNIVQNAKAHPPFIGVSANDRGDTREIAANEVNGFTNDLQHYLSSEQMSKHLYLPPLRIGLIYADSKWLPGRPTMRKAVSDIYSSNLVVYGLLHKPTGVFEYDRLFKDVIDSFVDPRYPLSPLESEEFDFVLDGHAQSHPEDALAVQYFKQQVHQAQPHEEAGRAA